MKDKIRIGVVGLGGRSIGMLKDAILLMDDIVVSAICDSYPDRVQEAADMIEHKQGQRPVTSTDYHEIIGLPQIDAVMIFSAWESHIPVAIEAMRAKKYVAMEVGGAYSIMDCWDLVHTSEQTGMPCMLLENCCYDRRELMVLNMVRQGLFGSIVHCAGGYQHDLRHEISYGAINRHYRLRNYISRNCENYPTHELGPIANVLDINRGNRMLSLCSVATRASGLHEYINAPQRSAELSALTDTVFSQADIVTTTIRCAGGQTIVLTLDTTLPRAYCRGFTVRGTKGMYTEENDSVFIDGVHDAFEFDQKKLWGNARDYEADYLPRVWRDYEQEGVKGGHGGIDWLVLRAFFESIQNNTPVPIDVYDAAAWMAVSCLSEDSIACGGSWVAIPDFTHGMWIQREPNTLGL